MFKIKRLHSRNIPCYAPVAGGIEVLPHAHDVLAVAFRPDGKQLACATLDGQLHLWDPLEGELQVLTFSLHNVSQQECCNQQLHSSLISSTVQCHGLVPRVQRCMSDGLLSCNAWHAKC